MGSLNRAHLKGFLAEDPKPFAMHNDSEMIVINVTTCRRDIPTYVSTQFETVQVICDVENNKTVAQLLEKLKKYDLIDVTGVVNIRPIMRRVTCKFCGMTDEVIQYANSYIQAQAISKLDNVEAMVGNEHSPEEHLRKHFYEDSHEIIMIGNVVSTPQLRALKQSQIPVCGYKIGIDRQYFIRSEPDTTADYPWIYSYGDMAVSDFRHLVGADPEKKELGSLITFRGFAHSRNVEKSITCKCCGHEIPVMKTVTSYIPYSIEYLSNYKTDEDLAREEFYKARGFEFE